MCGATAPRHGRPYSGQVQRSDPPESVPNASWIWPDVSNWPRSEVTGGLAMDTIDSITPVGQRSVEAMIALVVVAVMGAFGVRRVGVYAWYIIVLAVAAIVA